MTNYVSINPGSEPTTYDYNKEFAALVKVTSSRYAEHMYQEGSGIPSKVGIKWVMETTKGNTFERSWPTGLTWEENKTSISPDGKRIAVAIKKNSDAFYMIQSAINTAGFPSDRVTDDVSVFEGNTFFMAMDVNQRAPGSARKIYPKKYHPEGWEQAKAEAIARREAREATAAAAYPTPGATTATPASTVLTGSYNPPPVVIQTNVRQVANEALVDIVTKAGGKVDRAGILNGLNDFKPVNTWPPSFRQEVTLALWDYNQTAAIVEDNPRLNIEGGPAGFTVSYNK